MARRRPARTLPDAFGREMAGARAAAGAGRLAAALAHAQAALALRPRSFDALFLTAVTLQRLGRGGEAIPYYERAILAEANAAEAHHNLGCALLTLGKIDDGAAALRRALALRPDDAATLDALGFATARQGAAEEARALFERSLQLDAGSPSVHGRLGNLLLRMGRFEDARVRFVAALERFPDSAELHDGLGVALGRLEDTVGAQAAHRRALACDPAYANAACNLGKVLLETGDVDEALTCFDRAIALEPRNGSFYLPLMTGGSLGVRPAHVDAMLALGRSIGDLPREQQIDLHFALGNVHERAGRFAEAFEHLRAGNALKRAELPYDERAALAYVESILIAFGNPYMEELRGCGPGDERPVFIVGMPRSGSTLVEALLAAHPAVTGAGEIGVLGAIVRDMWPAISATTVPELRAQVRRIGERYLEATAGGAAGALRLTDKTLENVQLLPLIHVTLPNARIVHIRRDDLDTCVSCFATSFADQKVPFAYDLGELGRYYRSYLILMERWRAFVPPDRLLDVSYERLVEDFEHEARRIVAFCGLDWDPACLAFHQVRRVVRTASNLQVRQPLYRSAVGRAQPFRPYLDELIRALQTVPSSG
jgi:tetratricopeptide (TPR) repeat protein